MEEKAEYGIGGITQGDLYCPSCKAITPHDVMTSNNNVTMRCRECLYTRPLRPIQEDMVAFLTSSYPISTYTWLLDMCRKLIDCVQVAGWQLIRQEIFSDETGRRATIAFSLEQKRAHPDRGPQWTKDD